MAGSIYSDRSKTRDAKLHRISESADSEPLMPPEIEDDANNNKASQGELKTVGSGDVRIKVEPVSAGLQVEVVKKEHPLWIRIGAALFYVISSTIITMANKVVLTSFQ